MKKFTQLLIVLVASLIMPQAVKATVTITVSGGTATVETQAAGEVAAITDWSSYTGLGSATTIVLNGYFNSNDLSELAKYTGLNETKVKVDMTEAKFSAPDQKGANFYVYNTETNLKARTQNTGDLERAYVGGYIYKLSKTTTKGWQEYPDVVAAGATEITYNSQSELAAATDLADGTIGKYPTGKTFYCKLEEVENTEHGTTVRQWTDGTETEPTGLSYPIEAAKDPNGNTIDYGRHTNILYGTNLEVGKWYSFTQYSYAVYENSITDTWTEWTAQEYTDNEGKTKDELDILGVYNTYSEMEFALIGADEGKCALVLEKEGEATVGTRYKYESNEWVVNTDYDSDKYDWSQMKFSHWGTKITEAVTSNYVTGATGYEHGTTEGARVTNGLAGDIFKGCTALKKVTYMSGNAIGFQDTQDSYALEEVVFGKQVTWINDGAFQRCKTLKTFSFVDACSTDGLDLYIDGGAFAEATQAEIVGKFPTRLKEIFTRAFYEAKVGKFEVCEENGLSRMTEIGNTAFGSSKVSEIVVPLSVTTIKANAFQSTNSLSKVTFLYQVGSLTNSAPLKIETSAFTGGNEGVAPTLDVYINFSPTTRRIVCEYDAFNYTQMQGQTDTQSSKFGCLHFPTDEAGSNTNWDYYQGDWKKGLAFRQSSLNAFKDGYTDTEAGYDGKNSGGTIDGTSGKYEHNESGKQYTPANGWQQFTRTDTGIDIIIPKGDFIRSYSTLIPYYIPKYSKNDSDNSLIGKQMFHAYRITNFKDGWTDQDINDATAASQAERKATAIEVPTFIPSNTGLILTGNVNVSYLVYLEEAPANAEGLVSYPYKQTVLGDTNASTANLLYPTCIDDGHSTTTVDGVSKVIINPTMPYPIGDLSTNQDSKYRIFGFKKADVKFYRSKPNVKMNRDMAYLKLPISLFHWANEGSSGADQSGVSSSSTNSAKVAVIFGEFDEFSETTGISNVSDSTNENANVEGYFTLQGVKVEAPTQKGIYIHNGKKIMVK